MRSVYLLISMLVLFMCSASAQNTALDIDTLLAWKLNNEGEKFLASEEYSDAITSIQQARDIYLEYELWAQAIRCEVHLAEIADNFDTPDLKIRHSSNALSLANKYLKKDNLALASAYRQKAEALMWVEQLDSANYFLNIALPIFIKEKDWEECAWTEVLLAVNNLNSYQLDSCVHHLDQVDFILRTYDLPKPNHDDVQTTLFDLRGVVYDFQGDYDKAIKNINEALEMNLNIQKLTVADSGFISNQFNTLGSVYLTMGDYLRAEDNFLQAMHFDEKTMDDPNFLNNIGHQYLKQEKYSQAIKYFERSNIITKREENSLSSKVKSNTRYFVESLNSLCSCYKALGKYDKALSYCRKAASQQVNHEKYITWATMGQIFMDMKRPDRSIHFLKEAQKDLAEHLANFHDKALTESKILFLLGEAHSQKRNFRSALTYFQKSLIANHKSFQDSLNLGSNPEPSGVFNPIYFLETMTAKAKTQMLLAEDEASSNEALGSYQLAIQLIDSLQESYVLETTQINWNAKFKPIYEQAINICYALYKSTESKKYLNLAFGFSEKSRSSVLLEQLKSKEGKNEASIPDSLLQRGKDLQLDIVFYNKILAQAREVKDSSKIKLYQGYLSQSRLDLAAFEERLEIEYPKFHQLKYSDEQISIAQIQQNLLSDKKALIEYFLGDSSDYVFVIDKDSAKMIFLDNLTDVKVNIEKFMSQLKDLDAFKRNARQAISDYNDISFKLYSQLLAKPLSEIPTKVDHLIIIPDAELNTLSFEAMTQENNIDAGMDFAQLPFLIYSYKFQYSFSAQLLFENIKRRAGMNTNSDCLGFGPSYLSNQTVELSGDFETLRNSTRDLAGTAIEISNISKFFDGEYYLGKKASESQFKEESNRFGILHLATHGTIDLLNSDYNHLKFTNESNDDVDDNLLYQYEIRNMDLNAQLVVLSACETGLGEYKKGEGVFSLARSFMYAGVPSVVMSLWRVSDKSTSQLMPYYYENISKNQTKVSAMQDAKIRYLKSSDLSMRHPFYWSAFVVIGEGDILKETGNHFYFWIAAGLIFLVILVLLLRRGVRLKD